MEGLIFDIQRNSFVDGPGIRTTVFFQGCNLRCAWCHNPESQPSHPVLLTYPDKCVGCGRCRGVADTDADFVCFHDARCLCGRTYTVEAVLAEIEKDLPFYEASGGGVTFSGGECMLQTDFLTALLQACREKGIHTAVDTAGDLPFAKLAQVLPYTDLFLYDVKSTDPETHKRYTGVDNRRILENLTALLARGASVLIRVPVVPGVNDTEEEMHSLRTLLAPYHPVGVELLPYHAMGEHKYRALGRPVPAFSVPSPEKMAALRRAVRKEM